VHHRLIHFFITKKQSQAKKKDYRVFHGITLQRSVYGILIAFALKKPDTRKKNDISGENTHPGL
jgi:hypothetical protein